MPSSSGRLCWGLALALVLSGLVWAFYQVYAQQAVAERALLSALRRDLLASRALEREAPAAYAALREWTLLPTDSMSRTDVASHTIFLLLAMEGQPYDDDTLRHVLCHELTHAAAGDGEHGRAFAEDMQRAVRALEEDGLLPPGFQPSSAYPAVILADE